MSSAIFMPMREHQLFIQNLPSGGLRQHDPSEVVTEVIPCSILLRPSSYKHRQSGVSSKRRSGSSSPIPSPGSGGCGSRGKYLIQRTLRYSGYKLLREVELRKEENEELLDFLEDLRFDYMRRPLRGDKHFVIHVPSTFHQSMAGMFSDQIVKWLGSIEIGALCAVDRTKEQTKNVAKKIHSSLAARVECNEPHGDHLDPDLSYTVRGSTFSIWKAELVGDKWRSIPAVKDQVFIDENGQAVKDCIMRLSLKDFLCEQKEHKMGDFEDVPLEISSAELHCLYKDAFWDHVLNEAEKVLDNVVRKADESLEQMLRMKEMEDDLAEVQNMMSDIRYSVILMRSSMKDIKEKMDKVDVMDDVEEKKVETEKKVVEVEARMAKIELRKER
ncbi:hypothetical protein NKR23_g12422 [Pleurostoma richardsiae]|uniref:Uncharacterized protein n=1 Tax=Pleurostoma richardsiae TaxID=41990 RepID=A0AA38VCT4_9PEZI|nr:hypothetical protein NKR23_g12422 [Pleurostoma richardsiae]